MIENELKSLIKKIVKEANALKDKYTEQKGIKVGYACIFSQNQTEFEELYESAQKIGNIIKLTITGPVFKIYPLTTVAGKLRVLKIRLPDPTRTERGDADFNVPNYNSFKKINLQKPEIKLTPVILLK